MPGVPLLEIDVHDLEHMHALRQLSARASRAPVPIVATASNLGPATVLPLRDGIADFIPQPIDRAEVLDVLPSADHKARGSGRELRSMLERSPRELAT